MSISYSKNWNSSSEYGVFRHDSGKVEYLGFVYAVRPRKWANVFDADRNWIASVCGPDSIKLGADIIADLR